MLPKDAMTKPLIHQAIVQLNSASMTVELLRTEMNHLAEQLPEYPVVMATGGVGKSLGPQLMAEIGDVTRFAHKDSLAAFAGVDSCANQSGSYAAKRLFPRAALQSYEKRCSCDERPAPDHARL